MRFCCVILLLGCDRGPVAVEPMKKVQHEMTNLAKEAENTAKKVKEAVRSANKSKEQVTAPSQASPGAPTRVLIAVTDDDWGLQCTYENAPFPKPMVRYQWLANGRPFAQVSHGDGSLPPGYGRGSLPEPSILRPREVPEAFARNTLFSCRITFSVGALKSLLTGQPNPTTSVASAAVAFPQLTTWRDGPP